MDLDLSKTVCGAEAERPGYNRSKSGPVVEDGARSAGPSRAGRGGHAERFRANRRVPVAISANSAGHLDELIDLLRCQMLSRAPIAVREAPRWSKFPVFGVWRPNRSRFNHRRGRGREVFSAKCREMLSVTLPLPS
jgi:hypothetical protein